MRINLAIDFAASEQAWRDEVELEDGFTLDLPVGVTNGLFTRMTMQWYCMLLRISYD